MKIYLAPSIGVILIGILLVIIGIVYSKKMPPWVMMMLILCGIIICSASFVMCLCLGFFMV